MNESLEASFARASGEPFQEDGLVYGLAKSGEYHVSPMSPQDQLKAQCAHAAMSFITPGAWVGVGTGSTVNFFIDALAQSAVPLSGTVSSSEASSARLTQLGIPVFESHQVQELDVYVDGADEIESHGYMIKGGGAALTREKIVAAQSKKFICIADESKWVQTLGAFPLPVEVIPMAVPRLMRLFERLGSQVQVSVRMREGSPWVTDNAQHILDVRGLQIQDPLAFESQVSQWPGVVTVGIFAHQKAHVCLLGTAQGVKTLYF
jgi:ribose 5-phosphate isomerase A